MKIEVWDLLEVVEEHDFPLLLLVCDIFTKQMEIKGKQCKQTFFPGVEAAKLVQTAFAKAALKVLHLVTNT